MSNMDFLVELFTTCDARTKHAYICSAGYPQTMKSLAGSLLVNMILMVLTYGSPVPGGLFIPCMVVGATIGRLVGEFLKLVFPSLFILPSVYALIGAASVIAGVTRMTVSLTVILFEITGGLTHVLPLMMAIMTAKFVADSFGRKSIYEVEIRVKEYPYINHKRTLKTPDVTVDRLVVNCPTLRLDSSALIVNEAINDLRLLFPGGDSGIPVLDSKGYVFGFIQQSRLPGNALTPSPFFTPIFPFQNTSRDSTPSPDGNVDISMDISELLDTIQPLSVPCTTNLDFVLEIFLKLGVACVLVTNPQGQFMGVVHRKGMLDYLDREQEMESQYE